jgi:hypothetical protein
MIDRRGPPRNRSTRAYPACPATPVAMDINEINSNVTASNQLEFFIGGLRNDYARRTPVTGL